MLKYHRIIIIHNLSVQQTLTLQKQHNLVNDVANRVSASINSQMRLSRGLIRIINTREALDLALPSLLVDTALISLLAMLKRGSNVNQVEASVLLNSLPRLLTSVLKRRNGSSDDGGTGTGEFTGDKGNALEVLVAIFARESEFARKLMTDSLTKEKGSRTSTTLIEGDLEGTGDGILARVGVASKEDGEALFVAGRMRLAKNLDDFGIGEPFRDGGTSAETTAELGSRDVEGLDSGLDLVDWGVIVGIREISHHLEGNNLNSEFLLVLLNSLLSIVRAVKILALGIGTGTGVVTANDEVGGTVVLADNRVPNGLAGTAHTHGEGKETESGHTVGVAGEKGLVDTDTGEVIDITGLGETDDRVDKDIGLAGTGSADSELTMSTVHGVASLESDDLGPAKFVEVSAELSRGV